MEESAAAVGATLLEPSEAIESPRRGPGRPRGTKLSDDTKARMKEAKARVRAARDAGELEHAGPEAYQATETEIAAYGVLGALVWRMGSGFLKLRYLTTEEQHELGAALAPVCHKYFSALSRWSEEFALAACVLSLAERCRVTSSDAEVMPDAGDEPDIHDSRA